MNPRPFYSHTPDGLRLSLRAWCGGPPQVLLVHGFGDNALVWRHFASSLEDARCAIALDLRGHGHSDWDPTRTYALSAFVGDVVHVLETLCPAPVVLVGHSLGAQVAVRAATACRERIRAVVLVDLALRPNGHSASHVRRKFRERHGVYESVAEYVLRLHEQLPLARKELLEVLAEGALCIGEDGRCEERCDPLLVNADDAIDAGAMLATLKQIAHPILIVRGAGSAVLSRAAARELLAELPQSRLTAVDSAGHTVMLDNPEGFAAVVKPYVLRLSSGSLPRAGGKSAPHPPSGVRERLEASGQRDMT